MSLLFSLLFAITVSAEKSPLRVNLNVGGMTVQGNLTQYQVNGGGLITYDGKVYGSDTVINGYRMWTKFPGSDELTKIGDDLNIAEIPYYYVRPRVYIQGFANYSTSQLHQIDDRYLGGVSIGYTPIRQKMKLFRASVGGFWEQTTFPSNTFNQDVEHQNGVRSIPRVGVISNGWYRVPNNKKLSFNYLGWFYVNPLNLEDYRYRINSQFNVNLTPLIQLRLGTTYQHNSVVMEGVSEFDLRSNVGLGLSFPPRKKK
jgi:hypothetical protein